MYHYTAYGLWICSVLALPELVADSYDDAAEEPDVFVRFGKLDDLPAEAETEGYHATGSQESYLFWEGIGKFLVRGGCEIIIDPAREADHLVYRPFVVGPVLAVLLEQRGMLILHASAVAVSGGVVAFMGPKGYGKSTMAAALHARGHPLVADDVTAVVVDDGVTGRPMVYPSFPQLKLWPEAAASVGEDPEELPRIHPGFEKRAHRARESFPSAPLPLRGVYVLGVSSAHAASGEVEIRPLEPQRAMLELVRHTFGVEVHLAVGTERHFLQCAHLVSTVRVSVLTRPWSLSDIDKVARSVERDFSPDGLPSNPQHSRAAFPPPL